MSTKTPVQVKKLSVVEKLGYSLGDLAANLVFQTLITGGNNRQRVAGTGRSVVLEGNVIHKNDAGNVILSSRRLEPALKC